MTLGRQFDHLRNEPHMKEFSNDAADAMNERGYDINRGTHGTVYAGPEQKEVLPAIEVGKTLYEGTSHVNRTYYNAHNPNLPGEAEKRGWSWADRASEKSTRLGDERHAQQPGVIVRGRPVLHEVEPIGHVDGDPVLNPRGTSSLELTADKLKITDTHFIPPVDPYDSLHVGNQGTLTGTNWNRWGNPDENYRNYNTAEVTQPSQFTKQHHDQAADRIRRPPKQTPGQLAMSFPFGL